MNIFAFKTLNVKLILFFIVVVAKTEECEKSQLPAPIFTQVINPQSSTVYYYFSKLGVTNFDWKNSQEKKDLDSLLLQKGVKTASYIAPNFGEEWYAVKKIGDPSRSMSTEELHSLLQKKEQELGLHNIKQRIVVGFSMGAINAMNLALSHPHDYHQVISISAPFTVTGDPSRPHLLPDYWRSFVLARRASGKQIWKIPLFVIGSAMLAKRFRKILGNTTWDEVDPFHFITTLPLRDFPSMLFFYGGKDLFIKDWHVQLRALAQQLGSDRVTVKEVAGSKHSGPYSTQEQAQFLFTNWRE
jgi:hypothetical protein